jgi:hypothetical protein
MRSSLLTGLLTLGLVLACGNGKPKPPPKPGKVGTPLVMNGWTATIHGTSTRRSVGSKIVNHAAGEGAELRLVDLTVENTGKKATVLAGAVFFRDAEDREYGPTPGCMFALGKEGLGGLEQIQPGLKKRGKVCYEVPKGADLMLMVRPALLKPPIEVRP